jgi:hypothetical protein
MKQKLSLTIHHWQLAITAFVGKTHDNFYGSNIIAIIIHRCHARFKGGFS